MAVGFELSRGKHSKIVLQVKETVGARRAETLQIKNISVMLCFSLKNHFTTRLLPLLSVSAAESSPRMPLAPENSALQ